MSTMPAGRPRSEHALRYQVRHSAKVAAKADGRELQNLNPAWTLDTAAAKVKKR